MARWEVDDLATLGDIAKAYNVTKQAASMWAQRYPGFPKPKGVIGSHRVYSRTQVYAWHTKKWGVR
jgi:hypothetical protein